MRDHAGSGCGTGAPHAAGTLAGDRTGAGVFDLAGNVREWTASEYAAYPGGSVSGGRRGRVNRGGSFQMDGRELGASYTRSVDKPDAARADLGFRCVVSLPDASGGHGE